MSGRDREPLSAEERELALRLSRLDAGAAPSAALDASILAAARTGASAAGPDRSGPARPPRPRWPVAMGLAASLAVAVGVAWQLRPQPDSHLLETSPDTAPAYASIAAADDDSAPAPVPTSDATETRGDDGQPREPNDAAAMPGPASARVAPVPAATPVPAPAAPTPSTRPQGPQAREQAALAASEAARQAEAQRMRADEEADRRTARMPIRQLAVPTPSPAGSRSASDHRAEPTGVAAPPPPDEPLEFVPPPPPPAPPAPPAPVASPAPEAASAARAKKPSAPSAGIETTDAAPAAHFDVLADQPLDDRPPASADSPHVREHWLQRIRELHEAGRVREARDSLREFIRRHPHAKVPADLRPLLDE